MLLGCFSARISIVMSSCCFVQVMKSRCGHLVQEHSDLSAYKIFNFSAFENVVHLIFSYLFHVTFFLQVSPNILSYAMWLAPNCCCTFYVSISPTLLRLRNH